MPYEAVFSRRLLRQWEVHSISRVIIVVMKVIISDVIIIEDNKVLLVQERKQKAYGLWNFPGGRVEDGETPEQAAYREIREELNVELIDASYLKTYPYQIPGVEFDLNVFTGRIKGKIMVKNDEIMAYVWFTLSQIEAMKDKLRGSVILDQARDALKAQ